ncbi:MAG: fumarylacetoacetate hydrolase family protein [Gammaproteobacteria bacterium]|nr:fumarylacetoacetate hydrolase family protein [Gammaproteobacteria bacterium]MCP5199523.1 fumarylacetoacetate hydrolase family protein [Gammaproteobacteria bacterium]
MKLARYVHSERTAIGLVDETAATVTPVAIDGVSGDAMIGLIEAVLAGHAPCAAGSAIALAEVRLLTPIAQPRKNVLCVGKNYLAHAREFTASGFDSSARDAAEAVPDAPIVFTKAPISLCGAGDDIVVPWDLTSQVDYEGELGVIIGRPGRAIRREDAWAHVFAYTVINDVTARDLQARHKQWHLGKSLDTFCPAGPWLTTADEVDAGDLTLECLVNGERRQFANTRDLIFDIPTLVATLSASMTLETGDIIATGTPAGVGIGFTPPRFLAAGDRVQVSISGLGTLDNRVV